MKSYLSKIGYATVTVQEIKSNCWSEEKWLFYCLELLDVVYFFPCLIDKGAIGLNVDELCYISLLWIH